VQVGPEQLWRRDGNARATPLRGRQIRGYKSNGLVRGEVRCAHCSWSEVLLLKPIFGTLEELHHPPDGTVVLQIASLHVKNTPL